MESKSRMEMNLLELLKKTPFFSAYSDDALRELSKQLQSCEFKKQDWMVKENEMVDSVFWIVKGRAEVYSNQHLIKKLGHLPLAVLFPGETIGLDSHQLYSTSGLRTASVRAGETVLAMKLSIHDLKYFLEKYGNINHQNLLEKNHRLLLIKRSLPFQKLNTKKLLWLEKKISEKKFQAGDLIFDQGETAEECYLIDSGEVRISQKQNEEWKTLASLTSPAFFGEMALLADLQRNARAQAQTDCKLLVLNKKDLFHVLMESKEIANSFTQLFYERTQPKHISHVLIYHSEEKEMHATYILKNTLTGDYFKLSEIGHAVFQLLDGHHTLQDIVFEIAETYQHFIPSEISDLISALRKSGFLEEATRHHNKPLGWGSLFVSKMKLILNARYTFKQTDAWMKQAYCKGLYLYFHPYCKRMRLFITLVGALALVIITPTVCHDFFAQHVSLWWLLVLIPFTLISTALHELAHAITTTHLGREVRYIGLGLQWGYPIAFTDTSDMWLAKRKDRIAVNVSGVQQDCMTAGVSGLFAYFSHSQTVMAVFWLFSMLTLLRCIKMMNPLENSDGYFLLMDFLEKPKLRFFSNLYLIQLINAFKKKFKSKTKTEKPDLKNQAEKSDLKNRSEKIFWAYTGLFILFTTGLAYGVQSFLLHAFGFFIHAAFKFIFPFLIILFNCIQVMRELK